jgi:hypothetical protein
MRLKDFHAFTVRSNTSLKGVMGAREIIGRHTAHNHQEIIAATEDYEIANDLVFALSPKKIDQYRELATLVDARQSCIIANNRDWELRHTERINHILRNDFPHGSEFDSGCHLDFDKSTGERLVIVTAFHHMDESGYNGWTEHTIIVTPSLASGFHLKITGRDRNNIKDHITELFS